MLVGVALGALGTHLLRMQIKPEMMPLYNTGVFYHLIHALALFAVASALFQHPSSARLHMAGSAFCLGILIFSGSLYLFSMTGLSWLGMVTPVGGVLFLMGWLLLASS